MSAWFDAGTAFTPSSGRRTHWGKTYFMMYRDPLPEEEEQ